MAYKLLSYSQRYGEPQFSRHGRVKRNQPCPICNHTDWCTFSDDEQWILCMRSEQPTSGWEFIKISRNGGWLFKSSNLIEQEKEDYRREKERQEQKRLQAMFDRKIDEALEVYHQEQAKKPPQTEPSNPTSVITSSPEQTGAETTNPPPAPIPTTIPKEPHPNKARLATEAQRADAIKMLLNKLSLSPQHRAFLYEQGFTLERAEELGYRTLPAEDKVRRTLLNEVDKLYGREITRSLGFVYEREAKAGSKYLVFSAIPRDQAVLLFPIFNIKDQPIAFKARWEGPEIDPKTNKPQRHYIIMSAGNTELGASVSTPTHVARPLNPIAELKDWVIVTEGERKADFISDMLGVTVLGVQGVSNWRSGQVLQLLAQLKAKVVVEAFDADVTTNPHVARAAKQMSLQIAAAGYRTFQARWPLANGKGLDDYLKNQTSPEIQWPDLHHFSPETPTDEQPNSAQEEANLKRYGIRPQQAKRIAGEFVVIEKATLDSITSRAAKAKQKLEAIEVGEYLSLEEARSILNITLNQIVEDHLESKGAKSTKVLIRASTGVGKTYSVIELIRQHLLLEKQGKIIYLTENKQAYDHLLKPDSILYTYLQDGLLVIREGRSPDEKTKYYCPLYELCSKLGQQRQSASADACGSCPYGSAASWIANAAAYNLDPEAPRPFACEVKGYLATVRAAAMAKVVIGPMAALMNGSLELATGDLIFIDENCVNKLLEKQKLTLDQLHLWHQSRRRLEGLAARGLNETDEEREGREKGETAPTIEALIQKHQPFDELDRLLRSAIVEFNQASDQEGRARLIPLLITRSEAEGIDLEALLEKCSELLPRTKLLRHAWERPYRNGTDPLDRTTPLRLSRDLVLTLCRELQPADQPGRDLEQGDTQLWLERKLITEPNPTSARENCSLQGQPQTNTTKETIILIYLPKQHLLEILSGSYGHYQNQFNKAPSVVYLDATAGPELKLALPKVEELEVNIYQPIQVTQVRDSLFSPETLSNPRTRSRVNRTIAVVADQTKAKDVVAFSRKIANPDYNGADMPVLDVTLPPEMSLRYGHFERHNKGLNDYAGTDLIAIIGPCSEPIDEVEARVMAFRQRPNGLPAEERSPKRVLRRYEWQTKKGEGLARWSRGHSDPDVQAAIEWSIRSTIMQTIGRGRAAQRSKEDGPLHILLFTSRPIAGLPITTLTNMADLLEESRINEKQRAALDEGRKTHNEQSHAEAVTRIEEAKKEFASEGKEWVAPGQFALRAGVSRSTLHKLGYACQGRQVRVRAIREVFSLDIYISNKYCPDRTPLEKSSQKEQANQPLNVNSRC